MTDKELFTFVKIVFSRYTEYGDVMQKHQPLAEQALGVHLPA